MKNMGTVSRMLRAAVVAAIGAACLLGLVSGPWALGLSAVALVFLLTSLFATCPAYLPFDISTRRRA